MSRELAELTAPLAPSDTGLAADRVAAEVSRLLQRENLPKTP
jgi:hypothetical protein